jgi:transposase-like protein
MVRKFYSISQKLTMVRTWEVRNQKNDESLRHVARESGVDPSQLRRWNAQRSEFVELLTPSHGTKVNTERHPSIVAANHP